MKKTTRRKDGGHGGTSAFFQNELLHPIPCHWWLLQMVIFDD